MLHSLREDGIRTDDLCGLHRASVIWYVWCTNCVYWLGYCMCSLACCNCASEVAKVRHPTHLHAPRPLMINAAPWQHNVPPALYTPGGWCTQNKGSSVAHMNLLHNTIKPHSNSWNVRVSTGNVQQPCKGHCGALRAPRWLSSKPTSECHNSTRLQWSCFVTRFQDSSSCWTICIFSSARETHAYM